MMSYSEHGGFKNMNESLDYYEILEVRENASQEVIKMAYKALALKYHPDKSKDTSNVSNRQMQLINEAFEVLSDLEKREVYDDQLKATRVQKQNYDSDSKYKHDSHESNSQASTVLVDEILKKLDIAYIDKRNIGGSVWVLEKDISLEQINILKSFGFNFGYTPKGGKATKHNPAYWLK